MIRFLLHLFSPLEEAQVGEVNLICKKKIQIKTQRYLFPRAGSEISMGVLEGK